MVKGSLSAQVYHDILERILTGRMPPGARFHRRQVAAELGVSVAPVLEAVLELQNEGLIETAPRKGTRIRVLNLEDLHGQLILREALECQAARLYCGDPVKQHAVRLMPLARKLDASTLQSPEHVQDELEFHHSLVALAGVPALTAAYDRIMKVGPLYAIGMLHPKHERAPRAGHVALLKALQTDEPEIAEAAMRAHARAGKEALIAQWERQHGMALNRKSKAPKISRNEKA